MEKIDSLSIPHIYNLYRCFADYDRENNTGVTAKNTEILTLWYYCPNCGTTFMVKHRRRTTGMFMYNYGEDYVTCPECKHESLDISRRAKQIGFCVNKGDFEGKVWSNDFAHDEAPLSVKLELYTTGNKVKLRAAFRTIKMSLINDKRDVETHFGNRIETFEFDVKKRTTTFKVDKFGPVEIGQPKKWNALKRDSMLRHLAADVLVKPRKDDYGTEPRQCIEALNKLNQELRKAVQKKWLEVNGYPLKKVNSRSTLYSAGGLLLQQIHYLAFRLVYVDLFKYTKIAKDELKTAFGSLEAVINDFDSARRCKGNVAYIMQCVGLPNKTSIRRILSDDVMAALELKEALQVMDNFDCNMKMFELLHTKEFVYYHYGTRLESLDDYERREVYRWLKFVSGVYKPTSLIHFISNIPGYDYSDFTDLMRMSYSEGIDKFTAPLSKMHDILVECHNRRMKTEETKRRLLQDRRERLSERGFSLNVPDAVKKRLVMQLNNGREKFFLPETNKDLNYTSDLMHNCVRTYTERIQMQECNVVYMTDDSGKLVACIEVRGNIVVQAKLKYNRPVRESAEVNASILEWAKEAKLSIDTRDIEIEIKPQTENVVAA